MNREFAWIAGVLAIAVAGATFGPWSSPQTLARQQTAAETPRVAHLPVPGGIIPADFDSTSGDSVQQLIRNAACILANSPPLEARLRYRIDLFGQRISGPGRYLQAGQGSGKTRIEFEFGAGERAVLIQQICDGKMLYNLTRAGDDTSLEFVDLRDLNPLREQLPAGARVATWLSPGSLTGLLDQLAEHFEFSQVEAGMLDTIPVVHCTGTWRTDAIERLMRGQIAEDVTAGGQVDWRRLPIHLPHQVSVTLGNDQRFPSFPYRILFQRFEAEDGIETARAVAVLELYELKHAPHLTDDLFTLPSVDSQPIDATEFYRQRIRQFTQ